MDAVEEEQFPGIETLGAEGDAIHAGRMEVAQVPEVRGAGVRFEADFHVCAERRLAADGIDDPRDRAGGHLTRCAAAKPDGGDLAPGERVSPGFDLRH